MPNYSFSLPILLPHRRLGKQSRRLLLRARWRGNARLLAVVAHGEVLKVGGGGVLGQKEAAGVVVTVADAAAGALALGDLVASRTSWRS